ncbi:MAG: hypothetical protein R6W89_09490 [Candidatus Hydrogenedentota bacterium]
MTRRAHSEAFRAASQTERYRPEAQTYDGDVVRGAHAGLDALRDISRPISEERAIAEVERQIHLLRAATDDGTGSYFAYRMGALGSLVADLMFPYGFPRTEAEQELAQQINQDIEDQLREFSFQARRTGRIAIDIPTAYFRHQRAFHRQAMQVIASDYRQNRGYQGYLSNAAPRLFSSSIRAVADAWHTVFRPQAPLEGQPASGEQLAWYYTDEIDYVLNVRGDRRAADLAYRKFEQANPGLYAPYEEIGDAFYEYGDHERAVREWEYALNLDGEDRRRVAQKLADHFMDMGLDALATAEREPEQREEALDEAQQAFRNVLRYDPRDEEAPELMGEVNTMIQERQEQRRMVAEIMSGAESVLQEARSNVDAGDYGAAFSAFFRARELYESVEDDFPDYYEQAQDRLSEIEVAVRRAVESLLDEAYEAKANGDEALENQNFDAARDQYRQAQNLAQEIPAEEDEAFAEDQQELQDEVSTALDEVDTEEQQWEQQQQQQQQQEGQGAQGQQGAPQF